VALAEKKKADKPHFTYQDYLDTDEEYRAVFAE
jgi:hypothetical protein